MIGTTTPPITAIHQGILTSFAAAKAASCEDVEEAVKWMHVVYHFHDSNNTQLALDAPSSAFIGDKFIDHFKNLFEIVFQTAGILGLDIETDDHDNMSAQLGAFDFEEDRDALDGLDIRTVRMRRCSILALDSSKAAESMRRANGELVVTAILWLEARKRSRYHAMTALNCLRLWIGQLGNDDPLCHDERERLDRLGTLIATTNREAMRTACRHAFIAALQNARSVVRRVLPIHKLSALYDVALSGDQSAIESAVDSAFHDSLLVRLWRGQRKKSQTPPDDYQADLEKQKAHVRKGIADVGKAISNCKEIHPDDTCNSADFIADLLHATLDNSPPTNGWPKFLSGGIFRPVEDAAVEAATPSPVPLDIVSQEIQQYLPSTDLEAEFGTGLSQPGTHAASHQVEVETPYQAQPKNPESRHKSTLPIDGEAELDADLSPTHSHAPAQQLATQTTQPMQPVCSEIQPASLIMRLNEPLIQPLGGLTIESPLLHIQSLPVVVEQDTVPRREETTALSGSVGGIRPVTLDAPLHPNAEQHNSVVSRHPAQSPQHMQLRRPKWIRARRVGAATMAEVLSNYY